MLKLNNLQQGQFQHVVVVIAAPFLIAILYPLLFI
jgi:hypothetical protein